MALSFNLSRAINYTLLTAPKSLPGPFFCVRMCVCVWVCVLVEGKRFNEAKGVDPALDILVD